MHLILAQIILLSFFCFVLFAPILLLFNYETNSLNYQKLEALYSLETEENQRLKKENIELKEKIQIFNNLYLMIKVLNEDISTLAGNQEILIDAVDNHTLSLKILQNNLSLNDQD